MADVGDYQLRKTRLLSEPCSTCIMRPGGIALRPGRLKEFVQNTLATGSYVVCHSTLPDTAPAGVQPAVCRGFADRFDTPDLQQIRQQWGFVEVPPPKPGGEQVRRP